MMRAWSSAPRISARLDFPAPIGPSTAMYRGLTLRPTRSLYPARVLRGYKQVDARARGARLLRARHAQARAHGRLGAARERLVQRRRRFRRRPGDGAASVDLD